MSSPSEKLRTAFSENEVKAILARAAELEATGGGGLVTAADLHKIAADAGIDAAALEQAIAEQQKQLAVAGKSPELLRILTLKNLGLVIAGGVLGAMAIAADGGGFGGLTALAIFGPSAAFAAWRGWKHRRRGSVRALLHELGALFGSFAVTIASLNGAEGFAAAVAWAVICGAGAVAIANRQTDESRVTEPSSTL